MTLQELKYAVEYWKNQSYHAQGAEIRPLLELAQATLESPEGWPNIKKPDNYDLMMGYLEACPMHATYAWSVYSKKAKKYIEKLEAALTLCRLARAKEIAESPTVEEIEKILLDEYNKCLGIKTNQPSEYLAKAVRIFKAQAQAIVWYARNMADRLEKGK